MLPTFSQKVLERRTIAMFLICANICISGCKSRFDRCCSSGIMCCGGPARACADTDVMKAPLFVAMFAGMASQLREGSLTALLTPATT